MGGVQLGPCRFEVVGFVTELRRIGEREAWEFGVASIACLGATVSVQVRDDSLWKRFPSDGQLVRVAGVLSDRGGVRLIAREVELV